MEALTQYILKLIDVFECETKILKMNVGKTIAGGALYVLGCLLLFVCILVLGYTGYGYLSYVLNNPYLAGLLIALGLLILGGVAIWTANRKFKK